MKQLFALAFLLVLAAGPIAAQEPGMSLNMTLFDHLNPVDTVGLHSALWGYVAPDGREYALFGSQIGTHIIDITDKPIRQVAFIAGSRNQWREMKVYGHYAYIVSEANDERGGLQIVDLSDLPNSAHLVRTDTTNFRSAHTVFIGGHYLYVMGTQASAGANGGVIILDLEPDPLHPRRVGMVNPYYFHDAWVRNDTLLGAAIYGQGCDIYDITDKAGPKHLATITYPFSGTHNAEITSDGGYVVTSDEIGFTAKTMKVWDIHDLENITKVAEFTPDPNSIVHNVHVRGRYVVASWYTAGVRILDMIDPRHPREVGYYDTFAAPTGGFDGVWEVYAFFPSGKVIAGDRNTGLYVLEFNGATAGSVSGYVRDAVSGEPLPGVTIHVPEQGQTVTSDAYGYYYIGGANGARVSLVTREFRYAGSSESVTFDGDQQKDILLSPLPFASLLVMAKDEQGVPVEGFSYAVVPHYPSATAFGAAARVQLPEDSTFTLTVGKWGYRTERLQVRLSHDPPPIEVTLHPGYFDDATLHLGWSFRSEGDDATTGIWTRLVPYQTYSGTGWFYPEGQPDGDPNGFVFQTGAPPLLMPLEQGDVNGGYTTLTSPVMDLSAMPDPGIRFDLWYVQYIGDTLRDSLTVQLSNDDGVSWTTVYFETNELAGWRPITIMPAAFMTLTDRMRIRFRVSDILSATRIFAAMDNFLVDPGVPSSAPLEGAEESGAMILMVAPNPARASAGVALHLPSPHRRLRLEVFDVLGRRRMLLHDAFLPAGDHRFQVADALPSGSYVIRATADDGTVRGAMFQVTR